MKTTLNQVALVAAAALVAASASRGRGEDQVFDFEVLRYEAKMLAAKPYAPQPVDVPTSLLKLNYDQYRDIRFRPSESIWRRERLPFELQFFHPGFNFGFALQINPAEAHTGIGRGREKGHLDIVPAMEADARETHRLP